MVDLLKKHGHTGIYIYFFFLLVGSLNLSQDSAGPLFVGDRSRSREGGVGDHFFALVVMITQRFGIVE